ncbi:uncharacterized protein PGRI_005780 [Penicillium griseofulvum]|uniref:Aflatoxin regulatory protein domain-containing protein n=1 Tax=Penicillium patulum TaxID=5078 RepID=A0A135LX37_PENPA|nr:uncharacterized protein PGRI_005780 [Penicillium griseofulvum]KXG53528.1 hypothetical protein PGRI_005780 [Penicillium griseofulvum]
MPLEDDDWQFLSAQYTPYDDLLHPMGSGDNPFDASMNDLDLDLNVDLDPGIYLDTLPAAHCMDFGGIPDLCSPPIPQMVFDGLNNHESTLDCSTPPFAVPGSIPTPFQTPPPPTTLDSCLAQNQAPCIVVATQSLRSLHIPQTNCVSRRSADSHNNSGPEPPRMSGSVLKSNKDAGMSVCRMLQCTCALRPQNQLVLAIICSRLIAWYRAMIRACFVSPSSSSELNSGPDEDPSSLEKVVHQPVTIGDHSVDDQALGLTIQAQVTLGELRHMQRLVETLSARMRETALSYPKGMQRFQAEAGLPGIAHDRLVEHLLKEVHEAKTDLMTAWKTV